MKTAIKVASILFVILLSACSGKEETGPGKVHWDRDVCARCVMAVSDHHFSAQIRGGEPEEKTKLYFFDDLGCAVIWLGQQSWKDDPRTEIWVNDFRSGDWIDARKAWYIDGQTTPMDYGLGAQNEPAEGALSFEDAGALILKRDTNPNRHGGMQHHAH